MTLAHDSSKRAKKARPLVLGERRYVLGPQNKWIDAFITGITDSGRSYDTQVDVTGGHLRRNCSHVRPRSPDIPMLHASFLQKNSVSSAASDMNALSKRENLVISGPKQLAGASSNMVLSEPRKGSIKQSNTPQVLVLETVPQRRVQLSRQEKKTRFEDNPVSSTVNISARQPRCDTSTRNRRKFKHLRAAHSHLQMLWSKGTQWQGVKWTTCENSNSVSPSSSKLPCSHRTNRDLSSVPPAANVPLPPYPQNIQVTRGLWTRYRQRMPMLSVRTAVTQRPETDCKTLRGSGRVDTLDHPVSRS